MAIKDQVNIPVIVTLSFISGFMILILMVGVQAWYLWEVKREIEVKWANSKPEQMTALMDAQKAHVHGDSAYQWVDKEKGLVAVPVEAGMKMLIDAGGKMPKAAPAPATKPTAMLTY